MSFQDETSAFEGSIKLVNQNNLVTLPANGEIQYTVTINQTTLVKNFNDVPFYFENLDPAFEVETDKVSGSIQLKGTQTDLSEWVASGECPYYPVRKYR